MPQKRYNARQMCCYERERVSIVIKYSIKSFCEEMGISIATAKNWIKTGKIQPTIVKKRPYFTEEYVEELKKRLAEEEVTATKSRLNRKKLVGERVYYDAYLPVGSINRPIVKSILREFEEKCEPSDAISILAYFMKELCLAGGVNTYVTSRLANDLLGEDIEVACIDVFYPWVKKYSLEYVEGEDILGYLYLSLRDIRDRKAKGAYYTPSHIVREITSKIKYNPETDKGKTILDPSCGTGNFLMQLDDNIPFEAVYGIDIDYEAVCIARANLALKYDVSYINDNESMKILYRHIIHDDFLDRYTLVKYDYIIGNPPWGYQFDKEEEERIKYKFFSASLRSVESAFLFVEKSYLLLNESGIMSLIVPESLMKVSTHKPAREFIAEYCRVDGVTYLGNIFHKVQCPSVIIDLGKKRRNQKESLVDHKIRIKKGDDIYYIRQGDRLNMESFQLETTDEEEELIKKIYRVKHTTLEDRALFGLGIVTGDNEKRISTEPIDDGECIIVGKDIGKYTIEYNKQFIKYNRDELQQVAPEYMYRAPEKLVYGFVGDTLRFAYDNKGTLTLNSCNIVIPQVTGLDIKYILAILNSTVIDFLYKKHFKSIKLLKSHIVKMPIPIPKEDEQLEIVRYVNMLMEKPECFNEIYDEIDRRIVDIMGLTLEEYNLIRKK